MTRNKQIWEGICRRERHGRKDRNVSKTHPGRGLKERIGGLSSSPNKAKLNARKKVGSVRAQF